jgi:DNA-binding transcriptional LysR family regulator
MNFTHLAAFYAVARAGSVSAGAVQLHVSQPAVTREIKDLEARLGLALFDRLPRGVVLTEAGTLLLAYAEKIFTLADTAENEIRELAGLSRGQLSLGASATLGVYLLPSMIARFNLLFPKVDVALSVVNTEQVEAGLIAHHFALGFIEGPYDEQVFHAETISNDEIVVVASADHPNAGKPVRARSLCAKQVILREAGSGTRAAVEKAYQDAGLIITPRMSVNNTEAIKRLVSAQRIMAYLPAASVEGEIARGELVVMPVREFNITRALRMVWLKSRAFSPSTEAFAKLARSGSIDGHDFSQTQP